MKHVVATILSLSVLVAGSALAAPSQDTPSTVPVVTSAALPVTGNASTVAPPAAVQAERRAGRGHADGRPHRGHRAGLAHHAERAHPARHHRHALQHGRDGQRAGSPRGHRAMRLGAPLAEHRQGVVVSEHRRHGLNKAPRGQEWRRIGDRYVRVTSGTNVVNEIVINGL